LLTSQNGTRGPFSIPASWERIQRALGISLAQAANLAYYDSVAAKPIFGKPRRLETAPHIFVAMPFDKTLDATYRTIRAVARDLGITAERADDIFSASAVVRDIWDRLFNTGIVVADCSGRNANVFYEIGIAHAIGKPVVLVSQADTDMPFDVRHLRYIRYAATPKGRHRLRSTLRSTIKEVAQGIWLPNKPLHRPGARGARPGR